MSNHDPGGDGGPAARPPVGFETHLQSILNILDDFTVEKQRLGDTQRALMNILEDANVERACFGWF